MEKQIDETRLKALGIRKPHGIHIHIQSLQEYGCFNLRSGHGYQKAVEHRSVNRSIQEIIHCALGKQI